MAEFSELVAAARVLQHQANAKRNEIDVILRQRDAVIARALTVVPPGMTIKDVAVKLSEGFPPRLGMSYGTCKAAQRAFADQMRAEESA